MTPGQALAPLVLAHVHGKRYRVVSAFAYRTRAGRVITVPAGFETDGGSVPRFLWGLYPPYGSDCDEGYVLHDYAYAAAELEGLTRLEADGLLREVLEDVGRVRASARWVIYSGVRTGGGSAWAKHRAAAAAGGV